MGITSEEFFQNIYNVIFSPKEFFENDNQNISTRLSIGIIAIMSVLNKTAYVIASDSLIGFTYIFTLMGSIISAVIMWFITALIFEYIAKIFDKGGHLQKFLYLSAFACIPSVLFAPLHLLKHLGGFGYVLSVILSLALYLWMIVLYILAIKNTYKIS